MLVLVLLSHSDKKRERENAYPFEHRRGELKEKSEVNAKVSFLLDSITIARNAFFELFLSYCCYFFLFLEVS